MEGASPSKSPTGATGYSLRRQKAGCRAAGWEGPIVDESHGYRTFRTDTRRCRFMAFRRLPLPSLLGSIEWLEILSIPHYALAMSWLVSEMFSTVTRPERVTTTRWQGLRCCR